MVSTRTEIAVYYTTLFADIPGLHPTAASACVDKIPNCADYTKEACPKYPGWAGANCKKYCDLCRKCQETPNHQNNKEMKYIMAFCQDQLLLLYIGESKRWLHSLLSKYFVSLSITKISQSSYEKKNMSMFRWVMTTPFGSIWFMPLSA